MISLPTAPLRLAAFVYFGLCLLLVALPAGAETQANSAGKSFYLDGDKGSDTNLGTEPSPWKTISHAQSRLQPGDTLFCTGDLGIVTMATTTGPNGELPYQTGTPGKPISYKAWPDKKQPCMTRLAFDGVRTDTHLSFDGFRFDRGEVDTPDSLENSAIYLAGAWHIAFSNCDVVAASARIPASALDPAVSMAPYTPDYNGVISSGGNASFVTIEKCRIQNGGVGIAINENEAFSDRQSRHWKILDNDISNSAEDGIQAGGWMAGSDSVVRGNYIHSQNVYAAPLVNVGFAYDKNGRNPAAFEGHQWAPVIQDVTGRKGIYYYTKPLNPEGWARIYIFAADKNEPPATFSPHGWRLASDPSIEFKSLDKDGVTPRIGDCAHTDCISIMAQMTDTIFENNRAHATNTAVKGSAGGGGLKIQNIPRGGRSAQTTSALERSRPPTNVTFVNNLFYSTAPHAGSAFLLNVAGGKNVKFIHNTIFGAPGVRFVDMFGTGFEGIYFYNNIISGGGVSNTKAVGIATSDNNLWMQPPEEGIIPGKNDVIFPSRRESRLTVEQLIESVGFVDSSAGDLRIKPGSPAQNIGALHSESLPLPLNDINGFPRGSTTPDVPDAGAYEAGSPALAGQQTPHIP
jgi:hypothetical protein